MRKLDGGRTWLLSKWMVEGGWSRVTHCSSWKSRSVKLESGTSMNMCMSVIKNYRFFQNCEILNPHHRSGTKTIYSIYPSFHISFCNASQESTLLKACFDKSSGLTVPYPVESWSYGNIQLFISDFTKDPTELTNHLIFWPGFHKNSGRTRFKHYLIWSKSWSQGPD